MPDNRDRIKQPITMSQIRKRINRKTKELGLNEPKNFVLRMGINSTKDNNKL